LAEDYTDTDNRYAFGVVHYFGTLWKIEDFLLGLEKLLLTVILSLLC
jgi:hypothetical protein